MEGLMQDGTENPRAFGNGAELEPEINENGETQASEEEQLDNDLIVTRARKMIFGKGRENILKQLGSAESPAKAMGKAASMLVRSLVQAAKQSGREISEDSALNAGHEIGQDLNELAKANGVFTYDSDEDEIAELQDASLWGVKYYADEQFANGEVTPQMQKIAQEQIDEGLSEEQAGGMKKNPVAAGVEQAMQPKGVVSSQMNGVM